MIVEREDERVERERDGGDVGGERNRRGRKIISTQKRREKGLKVGMVVLTKIPLKEGQFR